MPEHVLEKQAMYFPNPPKPVIYLLKVHGALDVFTFNDGKDLVRLLPEVPTEEGIIDMLRGANEGLFYAIPGFMGGKVKALNEIAYADDRGEMQFLRRSLLAGAFKFDARRDQVLPKSMLKHFQQNINFVTKLICIGYSFGDVHVNTVLREWLELSPDRRLEIIAPIEQSLPPFLSHLAPQVKIVRSTATEYLDELAGITRSTRDKLEKRVFSLLRSLGKKCANEKIGSFKRKNQERISKAFVEKLRQLPLVNGQPDFSAIGDPKELGKKWAAALSSTDEHLFEQLVEHLGENPPE